MKDKKMKKIGILGGTFNPIHNGHLSLASQAKEKFSLDKVIFIPSALPPHKEEDSLLDSSNRYLMTILATSDNDDFIVSDIEIKRGGRSYTLDTLKEIKKIYGEETTIYFITGCDVISEINTWKEVESLFKLCTFIVANRPGYSLKIEECYSRHIKELIIPGLDISSTRIREKIKHKESVKYLVPDLVYKHLVNYNLYS
ncbi:nicotinate-nucleotide adenylyltransferase [bacterium]|nr:nicotinate-nucleotide adenylyltransferase [bacterium]MBU0900054.1 nicotinate-nucleotide adenylyltransferase [bacterium]MBU1153329.1 nicotinate-nucleotide adenylyltransferase [bacterium]